jgi:hypothetical protein
VLGALNRRASGMASGSGGERSLWGLVTPTTSPWLGVSQVAVLAVWAAVALVATGWLARRKTA